MKDSRQPMTTSFLSKAPIDPSLLPTPPKADHICFNQCQVGQVFGRVQILTPERRYTRGWSDAYVLGQCTNCGEIKWRNLSNLTRGVSQGCQKCTQPPRLAPVKLYKRLTAAKQRCTNPKDRGYHRYGARGICFAWDSVNDACRWVLENLGAPKQGMELDRIDNNGDYAPGNLRYVTRKENTANRQCTSLNVFAQEYWPYAEHTVRRKLLEGKTRSEIIAEAKKAVTEKRKAWRRIAERLESMTYEMPETYIVTPYRGS